jgi:hypothetical protein
MLDRNGVSVESERLAKSGAAAKYENPPHFWKGLLSAMVRP